MAEVRAVRVPLLALVVASSIAASDCCEPRSSFSLNSLGETRRSLSSHCSALRSVPPLLSPPSIMVSVARDTLLCISQRRPSSLLRRARLCSRSLCCSLLCSLRSRPTSPPPPPRPSPSPMPLCPSAFLIWCSRRTTTSQERSTTAQRRRRSPQFSTTPQTARCAERPQREG